MVGGEEKWREGYFEVKIDGRRENKRERERRELEVEVKRFRGNRRY